MSSQRSVDIKVGIFVCISLFVGAVVLFLIGSANQKFDKTVSLYTSFSSVSGLKMGSQVRLSGLKIGVVDRVWIVSKKKTIAELLPPEKTTLLKAPEEKRAQLGCHPPTFSARKVLQIAKRELASSTLVKLPLKSIKQLREWMHTHPAVATRVQKKIQISFICVRMKSRASSLLHIRVADSVAMVKGKGLLGDSLIEISMGVKGVSVPASGFIRGVTPKGLSDIMAEGGEVVSKLKESLVRIEDILAQYSDPRLSRDLKGIVSSINSIMGRVKTGPGLLHDLFYAKNLSRDVKRVLFQLQRVTRYLANTVGQINSIMRRAKRRGTLVHSLLISRKSGKFAKQLSQLIYSTKRTIDSLRVILAAPQKPGTLLHKVLYTKEAGKIVTDLTLASRKLSHIIDRVNRGKGTLGAIINDPTAFEDFKTILGQVKRSRVFRALIRFVIKRDESAKGGRVVKP